MPRALIAVLACLLMVLPARWASSAEDAAEILLELAAEPFREDLSAIIDRGFIRMAVPHNPMFIAYDGKKQVGLAIERATALEAFLRETLKARVTVVPMPMPRDRIIPALIDGVADFADANLTITPEREAQVAFTRPLRLNVAEVVVSTDEIADLDALAGVTVGVRRSSSYFTHLSAINEDRKAAGKTEIKILLMPELLEDYELIEMVQNGAIGATIVDDHKAAFWSGVIEGVVVNPLAVHAGGETGLALRKDNPELAKALDGFVKTVAQGTLTGNVLFKRYLEETTWLGKTKTLSRDEHKNPNVPLIEKYALQYGFDPYLIVAQAFQESGLDQNARSHAGAVGVMQVLPSTAKDKSVGIPDISTPEANIHAGVKYLAYLRDTHFADTAIADTDRVFLALGAYNAGPGNLSKSRKRAIKMGLDPDIWFENTEIATGRAVSREPVVYVRNIFKYAILIEMNQALAREREASTANE